METKSPTRFPVIRAIARLGSRLLLTLLLGSSLGGGAFLTSADVIDNLPLEIRTSLSAATPQVIAYQQPNNQAGYYESPFEYGAQATLDPAAPNVLRNVTLPYYSNYGLVGGLVFRVYANDGALVGTTPSPGTLLSEVFTDVKGGGLTTLSIGYGYNAQNTLPPTVTVTLSFSGIGGDNTAGWYLSTADSLAGVHPDFFWVRSADSGWARKSFAVVPEPGVAPLLAVGGVTLGAFGFVRGRLARRSDSSRFTPISFLTICNERSKRSPAAKNTGESGSL